MAVAQRFAATSIKREGGTIASAPGCRCWGELRLRNPQISDSAQDVTLAVLVGSGVLAVAGLASVPLLSLGPLSLQMLQHLAVMNIFSPILALALPQPRARRRGSLLTAATVQLVVLWAWHTPTLQQLAAASTLAQIGLMALLAGGAVWFWHAIIGAARSGGWSVLGSLLLTGKLACLLGALLIFAPRDLYSLPGLALALCTTGPSSLDDQQLAGLLMVTACPMSYLVVGVALAARMVNRLDGARTRPDVSARAG
ncbi:MAG TPA: cytochrome c oxidase assembly protein [Bosea sp. (in: a-proteobacteria)]|uniref:cytochrome c oxidase assembly protein n=1 Tax=Bosea sp. (in: a-proteobacteria) TaxID=1871050 RepID=UPI002E0F965D|nr:cytochrome c oxidase assembly protein [Bosea sp. (in: a-proteobacteria)]